MVSNQPFDDFLLDFIQTVLPNTESGLYHFVEQIFQNGKSVINFFRPIYSLILQHSYFDPYNGESINKSKKNSQYQMGQKYDLMCYLFWDQRNCIQLNSS